jgi:adenylyl- and sulfurtransferase ThiI
MSAKTPKILITIDEHDRRNVSHRVRTLLRALGAPRAVVLEAQHQGVLEVWVPGDPRPLVQAARARLSDDPTAFLGTHRWIPVESWTAADPRDLAAYAALFSRSLAPNQSWKVEVRKHESDYSRSELIENISRLIEQPRVDLEHPDRLLHVSALGERLGFSDLEPDQLFDVPPHRPER